MNVIQHMIRNIRRWPLHAGHGYLPNRVIPANCNEQRTYREYWEHG